MRNVLRTALAAAALTTLATPALAAPGNAPAPAPTAAPASPDMASVLARLDRLEAENAQLKQQVAALESERDANRAQQQAPAQAYAPAPVPAPVTYAATPVTTVAAVSAEAPVAARPRADAEPVRQPLGTDAVYSGKILNHTELVNQRRIVQLTERQNGGLNNIVTLSGEVIAIANAHWSNRPNKFGYLMRHPTGNNQRTKATQEVTINSVQLGFTITPSRGVTGYFEMLYDPEQSFGAGTLVALTRNQVQVRKAYIMVGDLNVTPFYFAAGKMDVPFGLQDSVSPFTNSSNWHAFAPLAYGGELGFYSNGLSIRAMAVQGGAQFRSANTPVDGTAIPSKLNNFSIDANYTAKLGDRSQVMLGGSYIHGSAYCQPYPIVHFGACTINVPAWSVYGRLNLGQFELIGDFARTTKEWPGTQVPNPANPLAIHAASKVTSFTVGGRYTIGQGTSNTKLSLEFSKFIPGPKDSPWHRQDQTVIGISRQFNPNLSVFGEFINVSGFVPLNFVSGGNFPDGSTWSEYDARSKVVMTGIRLGF